MGVKLAGETGDAGRETGVPYASLVSRLSYLATYRAIARLAAALPIEPLAGRRSATGRWITWAAARPRPFQTIWYHAASVGEALAIEPVIRRMSAHRPGLTAILTFTSPSLARWPNPLPVAQADFAPAETRGDMARVFEALNPALLVFSRSDLWPEMLIAASWRGVPVAVVGGTVRVTSSRLRWPARALLAPLYASVRFVGAVSEIDATRWHTMGVPRSSILVTGDPRHDHVLERVTNMTALRPLADWASRGGPVLVAGSVEREDLEPVLAAFRVVVRARPDARLVLVPHKPSVTVDAGVRWAPGEPAPDERAGLVVVHTLGLLADLYALATVAFVGGGLGPRGQHSTIEPAVYAVPLLRPVASGPTLAEQWLTWLNDPPAARAAGLAARGGIRTGAASATAHPLIALLR